MSSDNPSGADDQQETANAGSSETARQARSDERHVRTVKVQSDPYGDTRSQAEMTCPHKWLIAICGVTNMPKVAKFLVG